MPGNIRTSLAPYQKDIPDVCFSQVTAALKARLQLDGSTALACMVATATSQGNLLIFHQRKLLKCCQLPFRDCSEILLYHSFQSGVTKEFLVAVSFTKGGVVIDLQQSSVVKSWPDAKKIEVKDEYLQGYPQLVVHFNEDLCQDKIVVTHECNWEVMPVDASSSSKSESAVNSVVQALENQLKNVHGKLHLLEKQISLRQSIVNRSLTALNDTVMCKSSRIQAPSYTTKVGKGDTATSEVGLIEEKDFLNHVETCGVWQFLDYVSDSWVIGAAFVNISEGTLSDIQCFFTSKSENASYRINYYNTGSKVSTNLSSPSVGFSIQDLIETSNSFSGKLEHKSALVVIVVTPIPKFLNTEEETGSLLLACKSSNSQRIFQSSLGSVRLSFSDVSSQNMNFNPSVIDLTSIRRNVLGLISLLTTEKDAVVSTIFSSASRSFKKAAQQLNMQYLAPMQCFYSHGVYGHVCILMLDNVSPNRANMKILALSETKVNWFIRQLKSALSDDCVFTLTTANAKVTERNFLGMSHLNSALALLSNAEVGNEDELMVIEEETAGPVDSPIERIRREFLKKQGKFLGISKERRGSIKIAIEHYRQFQHSRFV